MTHNPNLKKVTVLLLTLTCFACMAATAVAQQQSNKLPLPTDQPAHPAHKSGGNLAEKATDPSAVLMQMQFQYFSNHDRDSDDGKVIL